MSLNVLISMVLTKKKSVYSKRQETLKTPYGLPTAELQNRFKLILSPSLSLPTYQFPQHQPTTPPPLPPPLPPCRYRQLPEPIIPYRFHQPFIDFLESPTETLRIFWSLPQLNRDALSYLIRFLQVR